MPTLEDCLRVRMAQKATAFGLGDDDWDDEALLTTVMVGIDQILDNNLNEQLGRRQLSNTQYFDIGSDAGGNDR